MSKYPFNIKISELKNKITIILKSDTDEITKDEDGKPIRYKTNQLETRCKIKYLYGKEYENTEKDENIQKLDFYVRKRGALSTLDCRGSIIFQNKEFNIIYVNDLGEFLEIRGEHYFEFKD